MTKKWWSYTAYIDTGFYGAEHTEQIDLRDHDITQEKWESMSFQEKSEFFETQEFAENLLHETIETGIRHTENNEEKY